MTTPPSQLKIYHITHVDNLVGIVAEGGLISDLKIITRGGSVQSIGISDIKRRRMKELDVACQASTGEVV